MEESVGRFGTNLMKLSQLGVAVSLQLSLLVLVVTSVIQAQARRTAKIDSGELYLVVKNGRFGYIDRNGRVAIQPQYDWAFPFSEGLALVVMGKSKTRSEALILIKQEELLLGRLTAHRQNSQAV